MYISNYSPPSVNLETDKALIIHDEPNILYPEVLNQLIRNNYIVPEIIYKISKNVKVDKTANISPKVFYW